MAQTGHMAELTKKSAACGLCNGRGSCRHIQLIQNIGQVAMCGVITHEKAGGNRLIAKTLRHKL